MLAVQQESSHMLECGYQDPDGLQDLLDLHD